MRRIALAAALGVSLAMSATAHAETWTDPNGRLTFDKPSGWNLEVQGSGGSQTVVLVFNANHDCYLFGVPNPNTANSSPDAARNTTTPLTPAAWMAATSSAFPNGAAQVISQSVDTSGFWPVQRAQLQGSGKTVYGAIQARPGFELRAFCAPYEGTGSASTYEALFASVGHPNDAAWEQRADEQVADRAARAAANAATEAENAARAAEAAAAAEARERDNRSRHERRNN